MGSPKSPYRRVVFVLQQLKRTALGFSTHHQICINLSRFTLESQFALRISSGIIILAMGRKKEKEQFPEERKQINKKQTKEAI